MPAVLKITDGTLEVNLIKPPLGLGYHLEDWRPSIPDYKRGGTWQDSPLAMGRRLSQKQFENAVETFRLKANEADQDQMIRELQDLRRLLEKASYYWTSDWQDEPVWIEARASEETNTRYALIHKGSITEDEAPYRQPWLQANCRTVIDRLTLVIEHEPWGANEPGTGTCVEASSQQEWDFGAEWVLNFDGAGGNDVSAGIELSTGRMLMLEPGECWRTDDGAAWNAAAVPPACSFYGSVLEASDGDVFFTAEDITNNTEFWRSQNAGANWVQRNATFGSRNPHAIAEFGAYLYMAILSISVTDGFARSNDDGATWTYVRYPPGPGSPMAILAASDGFLYGTEDQSTPYTGRIVRTADGTNWTVVESSPGLYLSRLIAEPGDGYLYVGGYPLNTGDFWLWRSSDGLNWSVIAVLTQPGGSDYWYYLILGSDGYYYMTNIDGVTIWRSADAFNWKQVYDTGDAPAVGHAPILEYSSNECLYVGCSNEIWARCSDVWTVGRDETCEDEVFVSNKDAEAQLTAIWVYDASAPSYTWRFPSVVPFNLLPNPLANNDAVYFGIETAVEDSGPFDNLIFDITRSAAGGFQVDWDYSDGVGGWPALNVTDGTAGFVATGVNSVHWVPPDETTAGGVWAAEAVNGITAYWVRAVISNVAGAPVGPQQGNRNVYTCNWARVDVDEQQVPGDIPALLRFKFRNRSDEDEYLVSDELDLLENRVICGLRSLDRGSNFTAYLNCSDEQNPFGIAVTAGTGTTIGDEIRAPSGRSSLHTTQGNGLTNYDTALTIGLSTLIAREFYGVYHAYLRAQLYEPSTSPVGDHDDVRVRLRIRSGSGGVSLTTDYRKFVGWDEWDAASGEEENYKDWQLLDFGQIQIPATGLLRSDEQPDETAVDIEVASAAATNLRVDMYDLVLIPVDEWAGDFTDKALEDDSGIGSGYKLDVDSLAYPKRNLRALVRTTDASEFVRSIYQPVTNGPAILQANTDQRLWFLTARGVYQGEHDGGDASAHLDDSYADFIDAGVEVGMTVVNVTDGSSATITAVTATQIDGTLSGGTDDDWDDDDVYYIICPHWKSEPWNCHSIQLTGNARYLSMRGDR